MSTPTPPSPAVIIGIDPGFGRCGFGIIRLEGRDWQVVTHGVMTTGKDVPFADRLVEIAHDVEHLLDVHQPHSVAMEELFFSKNTTTALKVTEVRGVIQLCCRRRGLPVVQVKPNEVKMATTGYGKADKAQVQEMIRTIFSLKDVPKPDDAADALAIAWTAASKRIVL